MNTNQLLSIVMPAYNEGEHICKNLLTTAHEIEQFYPNFEIIAVNDGSTDNTLEQLLLAHEKDARIKIATYKENRGKGGAICVGVSKASGYYIAFLDADLDLSPLHLRKFMLVMQRQNADIVIGSKLHKDSQLNYPLKRRIFSIGYYLLLRMLFHLKIKDTQTGVKLFRGDALRQIIPQLKTLGYAYDIELLLRATRAGFSIIEMPIKLVFSRTGVEGPARIQLSDILKTFIDTIKIYITIKKS